MTQTTGTPVPNRHTVNEPAAQAPSSNVHHRKGRARLLTALVVLFLLGGAVYGLFLWNPGANREEEDSQTAAAPAEPVAEKGVVEVSPEAAERLGIAVSAARAVQWRRKERIYGRIVENPRAVTEVRAQAAGRLQEDPALWPELGDRLSAGQVIGYLQVRASPEVRLDLQNKLKQERTRLQGEEEVVQVDARTVEELKKVTGREILSRAELETALVNLAEAKIQAATARAAVETWEAALKELDDASAKGSTLWSLPIVAPRSGTVVDFAAQLGTNVEPGTLLLRLIDLRHPLVRLEFPPQRLSGQDPPPELDVQIAAAGGSAAGDLQARPHPPAASHAARLVGPAPASDVTSQLVGIWYRIELPETQSGALALWRPGLQVQAEVPGGGEPQAAIAVPASAILFHDGWPLVYVRTAEDQYRRHHIHLLEREGDDWIVAHVEDGLEGSLSAGDEVASRQAQILLSKEFLQAGGEED